VTYRGKLFIQIVKKFKNFVISFRISWLAQVFSHSVQRAINFVNCHFMWPSFHIKGAAEVVCLLEFQLIAGTDEMNYHNTSIIVVFLLLLVVGWYCINTTTDSNVISYQSSESSVTCVGGISL
jgi:hypothetical protein